MNRLQLDFRELFKYKITERQLYAREGQKSLYIRLTGFYDVEYCGKLVLTTVSAQDAAEAFNELP